ncbi:MAG TPA: hypothetical protein VM100_08045 [Longimicrobiales bacterium]|nr:hypothetical protein [Longimicrobiales bacterium]
MRKLFIVVVLAACAKKQTVQPVVSATSNEIVMQVCTVDTIAPGGMMMINAIRTTTDTVVVQANGRVYISQVVAAAPVMRESSVSLSKTRYVKSGTPKTYAPGSIVLLGVLRGLPLYALATEGGPMRAEVEAAAVKGKDLEKALAGSARLRTQMGKVRFLFVPTHSVGCTFQQLARVKR